MNNSGKMKKRNTLSFGLTSLLVISQGLVSIKNVSAEVLSRAHGRCLFETNQSQVFDGYCTVKHKENNNGNQVVVVELDNDAKYTFRGRNLDNLHVEAWDGIHDVTHRVRENSEVFTWNVSTDRNRLSVKMDTKHKADASYNDDSGSDVAGTLIGAAIGGLIGGLLGGGGDNSSSNNNSNNQSSSNGMQKANTAYETILVNQNADFVVGLSKGELIYVNCGDITRINGDKRVAAMDSAGKKGYILTNAVRGVTCDW